jgi:type II secretory pathway pseudopilin PulG
MTPPTLHSPPSTRGKAASAFTLLEVILAVTIAGALLAAAAALMVSVTSVWMERQDRHFFEDHVDGVTEFLQASFSNAGTEITPGDASTEAGNSGEGNESGGSDGQPDTPEPGEVTVGISQPDKNGQSAAGNGGNSGGALVRVSDAPIAWSKPPGYADYQDPLLHFTLKDTPPLFIQSGDAPIVGVETFLHFEKGEGLSLLWYTPLQEDSEDVNDLRRSPISDLITQVEYIYWDEDFESWETETEPKEGEGEEQFILPRFLKLTFEYQGEIKVRTLTIPVPSQSALIF